MLTFVQSNFSKSTTRISAERERGCELTEKKFFARILVVWIKTITILAFIRIKLYIHGRAGDRENCISPFIHFNKQARLHVQCLF